MLWTVLLLLLTIGHSAHLFADVTVNLYATVQSDDGYLNLRGSALTNRDPIERLYNGQRVLVLECKSARVGRRWCYVRRNTGLQADDYGYVFDAELVYHRPAAARDDTAAGTGVATGFDSVQIDGYVDSRDGYLNLRSGPGTLNRILRRIPNGVVVMPYSCARRPIGARWCLVEIIATSERGRPSGQIGYVYDAEISYLEEN